MKMLDDARVALDADDCLVLVSPRLVWRVSLPGSHQQPASGKAVQPGLSVTRRPGARANRELEFRDEVVEV
jgi:hypothetical protein